MTNVIDSNNLEDIFNIDDLDIDNMVLDEIEDFEDIDTTDNVANPSLDNELDKELVVTNSQPTEIVTTTPPTDPNNEKEFVDNGLKGLFSTTQGLMDAASFILNGSPDAETIASASTLVGSIKDILSELNKSVLIRTRYEEQTKLEKLKIEGRIRTSELKAKQKNVDMGSGNTFIQNTQNNEYIPTSQEDIIDMIQNIQKKSLTS